MKRVVLRLIAMAAMMVPLAGWSQCSDGRMMIPIEINGFTVGDTWVGGALRVYQNDTLRGSYSNTRIFAHDTATIDICCGQRVYFIWHAGTNDDECYFGARDQYGTEIIGFRGARTLSDGDTVATWDPVCESCQRPRHLHVEQGADFLTLTWQRGGLETSWHVYMDTLSYVTTDTTYTFTGLKRDTVYDLYVRAICDEDDTSAVSSIRSHTLAASPITELPFVCNFEDGDADSVWTLVNGTHTNHWIIDSGANNTPSGGRALYVTADSISNSYDTQEQSYVFAYATIQLEAGEYALGYDWRAKGGNDGFDFMRVAVVPTTHQVTPNFRYHWGFDLLPDGALAADGDTALYLSSTWQHHDEDLIIENAGLYNLVFFWANWLENNGSVLQPPAAIDNIELRHMACARPIDLHAVEIEPERIRLRWTPMGDETHWIVSDGTTGHMTNNTSYTLNGLTRDTEYTVSVRAYCSAGDTSAPTYLDVRTLVEYPIEEYPFVCDFEQESMRDIWDFVETSPASKWYVDTAANNTQNGHYALYISCDSGATNRYSFNYSYNARYINSEAFAHTRLMLDSGVYEYGYDWRAAGSSSRSAYNAVYLRAVLVPDFSGTAAYLPYQWNAAFQPADAIVLDDGLGLCASTEWQREQGTFRIYTPGIYRLVFFWKDDNYGTSGHQPGAAVDNIFINPSNCPPPTDVVVTPDSTSVTFSWTPGGDESSWLVQVGNISAVATDTFYTVQGLRVGTDYSYNIAAMCGPNAPSLFVSGTFITECATFDVPFHETFEHFYNVENYQWTIPRCWNIYDPVPLSMSWFTSMFDNCIHSMAFTYNTPATAWLISPALNLTANSTGYRMSWRMKRDSGQSLISIAVSPSGSVEAQDFTDIAWSGEPDTIWHTYHADLSNYNGSRIRLAFAHTGIADYITVEDILVEPIPTCLEPQRLTAMVDTSTITLSWTAGGSEAAWEVSNGLTTAVCSTPTYTFQNLQPGQQYICSVRAICSAGDTSRPLLDTFLTAMNHPVTELPYMCDFTLPEGGNWTFTNHEESPNAWYVGSAAYYGGADSMGLYISNNGGDSNIYLTNYDGYINSHHNAFAYRAFTLQAGTYIFGFDWRCFGDTYDVLRVALVPICYPLVSEITGRGGLWQSNRQFPYGTILLDGGHELNLQSSWVHQEGEFTVPSTGQYNLVFIWLNDMRNGIQPPAAVDNVELRVNTCPRVQNIMTSSVSEYSFDVDWSGSAAAQWEVAYGSYGAQPEACTHLFTNHHPFTVDMLDSATSYDVWVRPICGAGDTGLWQKATLSTAPCYDATSTTIGNIANGYREEVRLPLATTTNYSLSEVIVENSELGGAMNINALQLFFLDGVLPSADSSVDLYIQPTNLTYLERSSPIPALESPVTTHVYHGTLQLSSGWNTIKFDTPYVHDGNSNILLIFKSHAIGSYDWRIRGTFACAPCSGNKAVSYVSSNDINTTTVGNLTPSYYNRRPYMNLVTCNSDDCPRPTHLVVTETTFNSATVNWQGTATSYGVSYKSDTAAAWSDERIVTGTSATFTPLTANSHYIVRVRSHCGDGNISGWTTVGIATDDAPCMPPANTQCTDISTDHVTVSWTNTSAASRWTVHIWNTAYNRTYETTANPYILRGLSQTTQYYVAVKSACNDFDESAYGDTVSFTTGSCPTTHIISVDDISGSRATVHWASTGVGYSMEYGPQGFGQGTGTFVGGITENQYTIDGLEPSTPYDVYVRNHCSGTDSSLWSDRYTFFTTVGIDAPETAEPAMTIYPNPTDGHVTVSLSGMEGQVRITVVDLNGRTIASEQAVCSGDCETRLELGGLAQGAYFVRVGNGSSTMVRRLVKK